MIDVQPTQPINKKWSVLGGAGRWNIRTRGDWQLVIEGFEKESLPLHIARLHNEWLRNKEEYDDEKGQTIRDTGTLRYTNGSEFIKE